MTEQELVAKIEEIQQDYVSRMMKATEPYRKELEMIRSARQPRSKFVSQPVLPPGYQYDQRYHFPDGTLKGIRNPLAVS